MTYGGRGHGIGDWCWHGRHATPCRVVDRQEVWGEIAYRVWLPAKDAIVRAHAGDLAALDTIQPTVEHILHTAAAAKLLDALEENLLLAPIQSSVVPLPHQLYALNRAMSRDRIRYLLADEVGLGKTIEAGLILRELKLRGMARRILVVAPKGLVRQWQAEMRLHFGENFQFIEPAELSAFRQWRNDEENLWRLHDQVICSLDSVKPLEGRRGWSIEQLSTYNRERFEDLVSASWDLVIIDEAHRMGGSTEQVARYKLGAALAEAAPYLLLLSATPHQGKTDQFMRLMQLVDRDSFPDESSVNRDRVRPFVIRTEKRVAINAEGQPLFKPRMTRLHAVAWHDRHAEQQRLYEAVTDYVRHGYNQAMAAKQRHIGFLMILMQRLVTSSTAAIRTTLEKRQALLEQPQLQPSLFEAPDVEEWAELDGQAQVDIAVQGLQNPDAIEQECDAVVSQLRSTLTENQKSSDLIADTHDLDAGDARKWRDHPAQFWLERAITMGLPARGGAAVKDGAAWRVRWMDGSESARVCFDARTAEEHPELEWVTLEDPRARAVISELPRCVTGQPLPLVRIGGLPQTVNGVWSLWEISLSAEDFSRRRFLSVFVTDDGRTFMPTAKRIWDLLLTEQVDLAAAPLVDDAPHWFEVSRDAARTQGERQFSELVEEHHTRLREERERALYAYEARHQAIGRIGLPAVRDYRRKRLLAEHETRMAMLDIAESYTPDLNSVLMLRIGHEKAAA